MKKKKTKNDKKAKFQKKKQKNDFFLFLSKSRNEKKNVQKITSDLLNWIRLRS